MKLAEITAKTDAELATFVTAQQKQLADVVIEMRTKQVTNVKQIAAIKQSIARAKTILRERELSKLEQTQ